MIKESGKAGKKGARDKESEGVERGREKHEEMGPHGEGVEARAREGNERKGRGKRAGRKEESSKDAGGAKEERDTEGGA